MRHRVKGKKLNRDTNHRKALAKNLVIGLVEHGEIVTTVTKAKLVKHLVDKLITKAKKGDLHSRRQVEAFFNKKSLTNRLVDTISPLTTSRNSGYTRVIRLGQRRGDNTMMAKVSLTDKSALMEAAKAQDKKETVKEIKKAAPAKKAATKPKTTKKETK